MDKTMEKVFGKEVTLSLYREEESKGIRLYFQVNGTSAFSKDSKLRLVFSHHTDNNEFVLQCFFSTAFGNADTCKVSYPEYKFRNIWGEVSQIPMENFFAVLKRWYEDTHEGWTLEAQFAANYWKLNAIVAV